MDPNYANLWNQMYSMSQHPNSSSAGMSLLEQAAIQTGLTPSFSMSHGMVGSQMLSEPSLMRTAPASMASPQPAANFASAPLPNTSTPRLPPFSNIKEKSHMDAESLMRETSSMSSLTMGHSDMSKWNPLFPSDYGVRASDPPPAHTGPSRSSSQVKTRTENEQLMDMLLRRQMEHSNPPKAHQPPVLQKYPETYSSTSKYQEPVPKFSTPPIHKFQDPTPKYPDITAQHKYHDLPPTDGVPGYLIQKTQMQNYRDTGKLMQPGDYTGHEMSGKYPDETTLSMARGGAGQIQRMMSSSELSPQSQDSSPHMSLSSPQVSHHNSPQMTNSLLHEQHTKYPSYGSNSSRPAYSASSAPSVYSMNQQNVSSATLHYEAVSPANQHSDHINAYNTLNLEGLANETNQSKAPTGHDQSSIISSPPMHSNSPMPVASPTSTVQHVSSGPIRAQADSTTKAKRGGGRRGGGRGGNRGGRPKKSKKEEDSLQQMGNALHMQGDTSQPTQQQLSGMHMSSQPPTMQQQQSMGLLQSPTDPQPGGGGGSGAAAMMEQMNMAGYTSMADTYGVNQYTDDTMLQVNMAQGMLGMMASPDLKNEQESILMNMNESHHSGGGGSQQQFMNDGEGGAGHLKEDSTELMSQIGGQDDTVEDNTGLGLASVQAKRPKQKTKAELKHPPQDQEVDEEFGHLATNRAKKGEAESRPKLASKDSSFQSSFLSFLQGNKQETLSSVTNSSITNKPELPKYIPEPPRPKPKKPILEKLSSEVKSFSADMKIKPVTFSDDEDSSQGSSSVRINQTVQGVISELGDEKAEKRYKSFLQTSPGITKQEERSPLRLKIKVSDIKIPSSSSVKSPKTKRSKSSDGVNHKKEKSSHNRRESVEEYYAEVVPADDPGSPERSPEPVVRQRSTRKAKEKVEEKRKARIEKKSKKKKKKAYYEFSDFSSTEDFFESEEEKDYDSDKDPVWIPGERTQELVSQNLDPEIRRNQLSLVKSISSGTVPRRRKKTSDDEYEEPLVSTKKSKPSASGGSAGVAGKAGSTGASATGSGAPSSTSSGTIKSKAVVLEECDSDDNSPHQYTKGNFVMEKKELCNPDKFVIWKIDAGKLIQKYEPFVLDGKLVHKSLSTYSSWSDYFRPNYMGIQVRTISQMKNQEVVEVLDAYQPNKEDELLESEEHMSSFNVFVQILVSHSLEAGFLSLVKQHDDDYYTVPLQKMEKLLADKKAKVGDTIKWNPLFKEAVEKYPLLRISEKYSVDNDVHCQASAKCASEVALKTCRLYGEPYNFDSLDKLQSGHLAVDKALEFHMGKTATKCLRQYHRLHHFKYRIYKKCLYMVECCKRGPGKDTSEVLDQCLQNRVWVQNLFRELKSLLELPGSKKSATAAPQTTIPTAGDGVAAPQTTIPSAGESIAATTNNSYDAPAQASAVTSSTSSPLQQQQQQQVASPTLTQPSLTQPPPGLHTQDTQPTPHTQPPQHTQPQHTLPQTYAPQQSHPQLQPQQQQLYPQPQHSHPAQPPQQPALGTFENGVGLSSVCSSSGLAMETYNSSGGGPSLLQNFFTPS